MNDESVFTELLYRKNRFFHYCNYHPYRCFVLYHNLSRFPRQRIDKEPSRKRITSQEAVNFFYSSFACSIASFANATNQAITRSSPSAVYIYIQTTFTFKDEGNISRRFISEIPKIQTAHHCVKDFGDLEHYQ